jgi:hypothetical protein
MKSKLIIALFVLSSVGVAAQTGTAGSGNQGKRKGQTTAQTGSGNASTTGQTRGANQGSETGQTNKRVHRSSGKMKHKANKGTRTRTRTRTGQTSDTSSSK